MKKFIEYIYTLIGENYMRQLTGAVYISFGILFYIIGVPDDLSWITFFFILIGLIYLFLDFRDFVKKKLEGG